MKSKLPLIFALAASAALPFAAVAADKAGQNSNSALTSSSASANSPGDSALFQQLDANKDGMIDPSEANKSAQTKSDFKAIDTNGDGKISADEWANFHKAK